MKGISPKLWEKLTFLSQSHGSIRLAEIAQDMEMGSEEMQIFFKQLFPVDSGISVYKVRAEHWIDVTREALHFMRPLSHEHFSQSIHKKIMENVPIKVVMDLLRELENWDQGLSPYQQQMIKTLDQNIAERQLIQVTVGDGQRYVVHPWKVLHLDGTMVLISEDVKDHCLMLTSVRDLQEILILPTTSSPQSSTYEVEEFIRALRSMNERETRLILKIYDPQSNNLFPDHHFLGKPCMITNPYGDLIWAAYVEPGEDLYEWLLTLGSNVEILDPVSFKEDYHAYCEEMLKKVA